MGVWKIIRIGFHLQVSFWGHHILAKSQVEKNFGLTSITTWFPCCALCNIILTIGWSSVPRYFIPIFSPCGTVFFGSSNIVTVPLPLTPLYGKFSSSIEKYTSGYAYILDFLCYFGCNNQKLFSIFVIIKPDRLNIGSPFSSMVPSCKFSFLSKNVSTSSLLIEGVPDMALIILIVSKKSLLYLSMTE